jgi:hypothetical protein
MLLRWQGAPHLGARARQRWPSAACAMMGGLAGQTARCLGPLTNLRMPRRCCCRCCCAPGALLRPAHRASQAARRPCGCVPAPGSATSAASAGEQTGTGTGGWWAAWRTCMHPAACPAPPPPHTHTHATTARAVAALLPPTTAAAQRALPRVRSTLHPAATRHTRRTPNARAGGSCKTRASARRSTAGFASSRTPTGAARSRPARSRPPRRCALSCAVRGCVRVPWRARRRRLQRVCRPPLPRVLLIITPSGAHTCATCTFAHTPAPHHARTHPHALRAGDGRVCARQGVQAARAAGP